MLKHALHPGHGVVTANLTTSKVFCF